MNEAIASANFVQRMEEKGVAKIFPQKPSFISTQINRIISKITGKKFPKPKKHIENSVSDSENTKIETESNRIPSPDFETPSGEMSKLIPQNEYDSKEQEGIVNASSEDNIESMTNESRLLRLKQVDFMTDDTKKFLGKRSTEKHIYEYYTNPFSVQKRNEMGKLTEIFLGPIGKYIFYFIVVVYLFGDLGFYYF